VWLGDAMLIQEVVVAVCTVYAALYVAVGSYVGTYQDTPLDIDGTKTHHLRMIYLKQRSTRDILALY